MFSILLAYEVVLLFLITPAKNLIKPPHPTTNLGNIKTKEHVKPYHRKRTGNIQNMENFITTWHIQQVNHMAKKVEGIQRFKKI